MTYEEFVKAESVLLNWKTIDHVTNSIVDEMVRLVSEFRSERNYSTADKIRNSLLANGVSVSFSKNGGAQWHWSPKRSTGDNQ